MFLNFLARSMFIFLFLEFEHCLSLVSSAGIKDGRTSPFIPQHLHPFLQMPSYIQLLPERANALYAFWLAQSQPFRTREAFRLYLLITTLLTYPYLQLAVVIRNILVPALSGFVIPANSATNPWFLIARTVAHAALLGCPVPSLVDAPRVIPL
jgi:hypothetical protein